MEWSLVAIAANVTKSHVDHIQVRDDCIVMYFAHTKNDQEGINMSKPWHIYANPLEPSICPVTALGLNLFTIPQLPTGQQQQFPGRFQYKSFMKLFHKLIILYRDELVQL